VYTFEGVGQQARATRTMDPCALGDLEQQRAGVKAALAANRRQLKQARAAATARAREWELGAGLQHTVLIVYVLAGHDTEPAVHFLATAGRVRQWPQKTAHALQTLVEDLFLAADVDELAALTDTNSSSDIAAMHSAAQCLEEWRLYKWSVVQNTEKGVAPSTRTSLQRLADTRSASGHADPHARGTVAQSRARMFMTRFRRRWGGRYGAIRECDDAPIAELVEKAFMGPA
jgi:hypothetical protein